MRVSNLINELSQLDLEKSIYMDVRNEYGNEIDCKFIGIEYDKDNDIYYFKLKERS
jgi:hypothetical protein